MAARKSCTHMTWAEAKAKSGIATGSKVKTQVGGKSGKDHAAVLAAKIMAKNGPDEDEKIRDRQAAKQAYKDKQRQEQLTAQREAEKEHQRLEGMIKPHDMAVERLQQLAEEYRTHPSPFSSLSHPVDTNDEEEDDEDIVNLICESKQLQVDEIIALQAIYADTDNLTMSDLSSSGHDGNDQLETLQAILEEWQLDPEEEVLRRNVVDQSPISFTLKWIQEDPTTNSGDDSFVAHMLFHISFPNDYPLRTTPPVIKVVWFLLTQKSTTVAANKPLDSCSMGTLDEQGLILAMSDHAKELLLGMPTVYALLDTFLLEHLFDYIKVNDA